MCDFVETHKLSYFFAHDSIVMLANLGSNFTFVMKSLVASDKLFPHLSTNELFQQRCSVKYEWN